MDHMQSLLGRIESFDSRTCFVADGVVETFAGFRRRIDRWCTELDRLDVSAGTVVALRGDYSHECCALMLALFARRAIVMPVSHASERQLGEFIAVAQPAVLLTVDRALVCERFGVAEQVHPLIVALRSAGHPGLILFSSGTTGRSKASLLDVSALLARFAGAERRAYTTLVFLLLDHIGGINTLLHALSYGGAVVVPGARSPDAVCAAIAAHRVELLPTSPTFLNMLLVSAAYERHDLSSLELITYGTEPMPETTLVAVHAALPEVRLKQTYGLSELGILPTRSRSSTSLWLELGREGVDHKIVDGTLWLRTSTAMLGYLNAPSPFDADGWFNTQDAVETEGDYVRILGRVSDIINVGGEKVYPVEVEGVLLAAGNVRDATVFARRSPITGQLVVAQVVLLEPEEPRCASERLRAYCATRLERFKVPLAIEILAALPRSERFKKVRAPGGVAQ